MLEPRRLLVVIDGMEVGGSQRQIMHLLAGLDRSQWQPELAYFRRHSFLSEAIRDSGIPVHYVPKRWRVDLGFLWSLARLIKGRDYALVHAYSLTAELWSAIAILLSRPRTPLIASERSSFREDAPAWHWPLKRFVVARSAEVIANSRAGAASIVQHARHPAELVSVIANGVDVPAPLIPSDRSTIRRSIGVPEDGVLGLFVGRLVEVKNVPCLIRALARVPADQRPWIAIVGDGPCRDAIEQLAARSGVTVNIKLLGERNDATRLMQAADFLVLPSFHEGMSNVVLEAMAAGCPVVASAVGGTPELVDNESTGLLFPSDDEVALASMLCRLTTNEALRIQLADSASDRIARHHTRDALATATSSVYERVLSRPSGVPAGERAPAGVSNGRDTR